MMIFEAAAFWELASHQSVPFQSQFEPMESWKGLWKYDIHLRMQQNILLFCLQDKNHDEDQERFTLK